MTLIVPTTGLTEALQKLLNQTITLRLYSNDKIPAATDTVSDYTEVTGGGYSNVSLSYATWVIAAGVATYPYRDFLFSDVTDSPGTICGYYITDALGALLWAERFPEAVVPFVPSAGKLIRITPRIAAT